LAHRPRLTKTFANRRYAFSNILWIWSPTHCIRHRDLAPTLKVCVTWSNAT
jgi:hypothetical protein